MSGTENFRIINAGLPKTASKSCTVALEILGFKVSDLPETFSDFLPVWTDYIDRKGDIQSVIKAIDEKGFNAVQDLPGNAYWEELYHNIPNSKVILTVRDSEEVSANSLIKFFTAQENRLGRLPSWLLEKLTRYGFAGSTAHKHQNIMTHSFKKMFDIGYDRVEDVPFHKSHFINVTSANVKDIEESYKMHTDHVIRTVASDRLLVWNVKDGWEPICNFLQVPVPNRPFPMLNKTSDTQFVSNWGRLNI